LVHRCKTGRASPHTPTTHFLLVAESASWLTAVAALIFLSMLALFMLPLQSLYHPGRGG
jgi:hypothetical protein